jgi:hypothetical protein
VPLQAFSNTESTLRGLFSTATELKVGIKQGSVAGVDALRQLLAEYERQEAALRKILDSGKPGPAGPGLPCAAGPTRQRTSVVRLLSGEGGAGQSGGSSLPPTFHVEARAGAAASNPWAVARAGDGEPPVIDAASKRVHKTYILLAPDVAASRAQAGAAVDELLQVGRRALALARGWLGGGALW